MKSGLFVKVVFFSMIASTFARAETVKLGSYSGRVGYFVKLAKNDVVLNAVFMNADAARQAEKIISKLASIPDINNLRTCEVDGLEQSIGYTIFAVKSCK